MVAANQASLLDSSKNKEPLPGAYRIENSYYINYRIENSYCIKIHSCRGPRDCVSLLLGLFWARRPLHPILLYSRITKRFALPTIPLY
jgi:hypothetical protein